MVAAEEKRWAEMQAKFDALPDDVKREQLKKLRTRYGEHIEPDRLDREYVEAVVMAVEADEAAEYLRDLAADLVADGEPFQTLPDDNARREALIKRLEDDGRLSPSQIDEVVDECAKKLGWKN